MKKILKFLIIMIIVFCVVAGSTYLFIKNMNKNKTKDDDNLKLINVSKQGNFELYGLEENYKDEENKIKDMTFVESHSLYYKIIDNSEEYLKYKKIVKELPKVEEIDFDKEFVVIITSEKPRRNAGEEDIYIYEISSNDVTTYIKLKQKDEPNYNNNCNNWYAVSKKSLIKENIEIVID